MQAELIKSWYKGNLFIVLRIGSARRTVMTISDNVALLSKGKGKKQLLSSPLRSRVMVATARGIFSW